MEYIDIVVYMLMIGIKIYVFSVILKGFLYKKKKKKNELIMIFIYFILVLF